MSGSRPEKLLSDKLSFSSLLNLERLLGRLPEKRFVSRYKWFRFKQFEISPGTTPLILLTVRLRTESKVALHRELASRNPVRLSRSRTIFLTNNLLSQDTPCHLSLQGSEVEFQPKPPALPRERLSMNLISAWITCSLSDLAVRKRRNNVKKAKPRETRAIPRERADFEWKTFYNWLLPFDEVGLFVKTIFRLPLGFISKLP